MGSFDQIALLAVIGVPLAGAFLSMLIGKDRPAQAWYLAIVVAAISFVLSVVIFARYDYDAGGFQFVRGGQCIERTCIQGVTAPRVVA